MRFSKLLSLFITLILWPSLLLSQTENFDGVSAPALPDGWSTSRTDVTGSNFITTSTFFDSAPNSLFCAGTPAIHRTMAHSPEFYVPKVPTSMTFRHRYNLESSGSYYDGSQLFFVDGGGGSYGADLEWTVQFGSFSQGGYNGTVSSCCGNFISGQLAWVGNSGGFITTVANLPPHTLSSDIAQIAWAHFADSIVASTGWWIDSVSFAPSIDLSVQQSLNLNPAILGGQATLTTTVNNPSSTLATNVKLRQTLPLQASVISAQTSSGTSTTSGSFVEAQFSLIPANSSATLTVVLGIPAQLDRTYFMNLEQGTVLARKVYALRHLGFSAALPEGEIQLGTSNAFDFFSPSNDGCEAQALGSFAQGRVLLAAPGNCSLEQKITSLQNAGAAAALIGSSSNTLAAVDGSSSGLTIPAFLVQAAQTAILQHAFPAGYDVTLGGASNTLLFAADILGDQFDPQPLDNSAALFVPAAADSDADGTIDSLDGCPLDGGKLAPGVCGCGAADSDSNGNGIFDCLLQAEFTDKLGSAQRIVSKLKLPRTKSQLKKMRTLVSQLKALLRAVSAEAPAVVSALGKSELNGLITKARKAGLKASRLSSSTFASDKRKAKGAFKKLLNSLAG